MIFKPEFGPGEDHFIKNLFFRITHQGHEDNPVAVQYGINRLHIRLRDGLIFIIEFVFTGGVTEFFICSTLYRRPTL